MYLHKNKTEELRMSTRQRITEKRFFSSESQVVVFVMIKPVLAFSGIYHLTLVT